MTDPDFPSLLQRAADRVSMRPPPVDGMVARVHRRRRRRTAAVLVGAVGAITAVTLGAATVLTWSSRPSPLDNSGRAGESFTVTVITELNGPQTYYFEGALTEVSLSPGDPADGSRDATPAPAGQIYSWEGVVDGSYTLAAAVRPCGGSCDVLDPPTDSCQRPVDVREDTIAFVTFHYGQGCRIDIAERAQVETLAGGTWQPLEKYLPDTGELKVMPGKGEVRFHDDGTWSGFDGCNRPSGTYRIDSGVVHMSVSTFDVGCANFSPYDQFNGQHVAVDTSGDHLTITDASGRVLVEYTRAS